MFYTKQFNEETWRDYKSIRMEGLALHENVYGNSLAMERGWDDSVWIGEVTSQKSAIFGLYDDETLIGSTAAFTDRGDTMAEHVCWRGLIFANIIAVKGFQYCFTRHGLIGHAAMVVLMSSSWGTAKTTKLHAEPTRILDLNLLKKLKNNGAMAQQEHITLTN